MEWIFAGLVLVAGIIVLAVLLHKERKKATQQRVENRQLRIELDQVLQDTEPYRTAKEDIGRLYYQKEVLANEVKEKRARWALDSAAIEAELAQLRKTLESYHALADLESFGLYQPQYDYDTPERYRTALEANYRQQENMTKAGMAATCATSWFVEGSAAKGKKLVERYLKLMLRAFNGEADSAVAKVKYNNAVAMEERLRRSFDAINKLGEQQECSISPNYLDLKLAELRLTHELAEKVQADKDEQRRIKEQMKDEEQARKELERAQKEAEQEEQRYEDALARARRELEAANDRQKGLLATKIQELEEQLAEAHQRKERAVSRAQQTRSGHVYVISNLGSFGPDVYKIGMTRRLDPMDRVRELSDASVPFVFDVHAMFFSDDAPGLESKLHDALWEHRVNRVNDRKEHFRVDLDQIIRAVRENHGRVEYVREPEAMEYRKTLAMIAAARPAGQSPPNEAPKQTQRLRQLLAEDLI